MQCLTFPAEAEAEIAKQVHRFPMGDDSQLNSNLDVLNHSASKKYLISAVSPDQHRKVLKEDRSTVLSMIWSNKFTVPVKTATFIDFCLNTEAKRAS